MQRGLVVVSTVLLVIGLALEAEVDHARPNMVVDGRNGAEALDARLMVDEEAGDVEVEGEVADEAVEEVGEGVAGPSAGAGAGAAATGALGLLSVVAMKAKSWWGGDESGDEAGRGDGVVMEVIVDVARGEGSSRAGAPAVRHMAVDELGCSGGTLVVPVGEWLAEAWSDESYDESRSAEWWATEPIQLLESLILPAAHVASVYVARSSRGGGVVVVAVPRSDDELVAMVSHRGGHVCGVVVARRLRRYASSFWAARTLTARSFVEALVPELELLPGSERVPASVAVTDRVITEYRRLLVREKQSQFKFGVLRVAGGQTTESEMLGNAELGSGLAALMARLGDEVGLAGFSGYRGGLDTSEACLTGATSYYARLCGGEEIMFHVAPLLPHDQHSDQQLLRKRHVGNDVVLLVFLDEGVDAYLADTLVCRFTHVIVAVQPAQGAPSPNRWFRIHVAHAFTGQYTPGLGRVCRSDEWPDAPSDVYDSTSPHFREWLLTKMACAEVAALRSAHFKVLTARTRGVYLDEMVDEVETGE
ncbi:GTPase activating protein Rap1-GAP [Thecamonas trahens ATCC 50062]|uniref:GTPase activating protein Rap1-GAP n=1 Tax=Thecamonas trahens ATCC 50062 TaxID=461836 RepID=A0A0L0DKM8_THETB|nr:GTPase activating protein Rap1-GAP [Thecamonas trahens ATCC 50062]KNC52586.1 GTPase activating protein Rap1-GAP [Thecamonas trahens ATCC 50062]|eukprot:XP_013755145.1 GTPase activating protein Rap1-GAP [Thecamonas trahens ATCC 50062]